MYGKRKKPGKSPIISDEVILENIKNFYILDENETVLPLSDIVWNDIMSLECFKEKIVKCTLRIKIVQNRNGILDKLRNHYGLNQRKFKKEKFIYSDDSDFDIQNYNENSISDETKLPILEFDIKIKKEDWLKIKPLKIKYQDNRIYEKLQGPWTDIIALAIHNEVQATCDFAFKRDRITHTVGMNYLTIKGTCREPECCAEIIGTCSQKPISDDDGIQIHIITSNAINIPHNVKRQCKGESRVLARKELLHKKAAAYYESEADELMKFGDLEPALLRNEATYRKIRQEAKKEEYCSSYSNDIVKSILSLISIKEDTIIRDFSIAPFHLFYWTNEQIEIWNMVAKEKISVSIDASGRFVKRVVEQSIESSHVFLYVIVTNIGNNIVPLAQMLSSKHYALFIKKWLRQWASSGASIPSEVITDNSAALQNAVCMAFNKLSYAEYLNHCLEYLLEVNSVLPACFVRMDIAHLIKAVTQWKCFTNKQRILKDFYTKCVGFMSTINKLELFEEFLTALFIISSCKFESSEYLKYKKWVIHKLETYDYSNLNDNFEYEDAQETKIKECFDYENPDDIYLNSIPQNISSYINKIYKNATAFTNIPCTDENSQLCSDKKSLPLNGFYCPQLEKNLKNLCKQFPVWTNSSAISETYFGILRNVAGFDQALAVVQFYQKHLSSINGRIKFSNAFIKQENLKEKTKLENKKETFSFTPSITSSLKAGSSGPVYCSDHVNNFNQDTFIQTDSIQKERGIHVRPQPNLSAIVQKYQENPIKYISKKSIIKNACLMEPILANNKKKYVLRSTSSFDSLFQLFTYGYHFSLKFRDYIDEIMKSMQNIFLNTVFDFCKNEDLKEFYKQRAEIMINIGQLEEDVVICPQDIPELSSKLMYNVPNLMATEFCENCNYVDKTEAFCIVIAECPLKSPTRCLKEILDSNKKHSKCPLCQRIMLETPSFNGFIGFSFSQNSTILKDIHDQIIREENRYILVGVIGKLNSQSHHVTFCNR